MKKLTRTTFVAILLAALGSLPNGLNAQEPMTNKSQLTIPWNEFKKLLNLEKEEMVVPLETFRKLVAQTGVKTPPVHTVKGGNVILTRAEFKALVDQMKPQVDPDVTPPFEYLMTKAVYQAKMSEKNTSFIGTFQVQVLKKNAYLKVPILPQSIALEDISVNGKPALVVTEDGYHKVVLASIGEHAVKTTFSVKSSLAKGPHRMDLNIPQTPITLLELEMPLKDIDVEIPQAQQLQTSRHGEKTLVSAAITPGESVSVRWRKKVVETEKLPAKLYAEVHHLLSIDDDVLRTNSEIHYDILHSEVEMVRLAVPEDLNILSINGTALGEWQEVQQDDQRFIHVPFTYSKKGKGTIQVLSESELSENGVSALFAGIRLVDAVRETGYVGVELNTSAEVTVTESNALEPMPVQKLPSQLHNKSAKPLILGFKYHKHPLSLAMDIEKHEKIPVPVATINSANAVTLFTEDGKIVNRLIYQVRNGSKQFLEIQMPADAEVWSVFVGKQPAESSINGEGKLLVPLVRSRTVDNNLDTFPVEIIYCQVTDGFALFDNPEVTLPKVDLLTSQMMWSVYLPNDYSYLHFSSTLEKEEMIRGMNVFTAPKRQYDQEVMSDLLRDKNDSITLDDLARADLNEAYKGDNYESRFRNNAIKKEELSKQLGAELEFGGRLQGLKEKIAQAPPSGGVTATGVLPIQIHIPTSGQVYRFAKSIITPDDPLTMSVIYTRQQVFASAKWLGYALLLLVIYLKRKAIRRLLGQTKTRIESFYKRNETVIKAISESRMTPFVLFGLVLLFSLFSSTLMFMTLFFLGLSLVWHLLQFLERRAQARKLESQNVSG